MSKMYIISVELDTGRIPEGVSDVGYIENEAGWMEESGIYVKSVQSADERLNGEGD